MNARNNGRSPNDRQLEHFFESVGELGKDELLVEFEQTFGKIVPPVQAETQSRQVHPGKPGTAIYGKIGTPPDARRRRS